MISTEKADLLTPHAAAKLSRLTRMAAEMRPAADTIDALGELETARSRAAAQVDRFEKAEQVVPSDLARRLENAAARYDEAAAALQARQAKYGEMAGLLTAIERWLDQFAGGHLGRARPFPFRDARPVDVPKCAPGLELAEIEKLRAKIEALRAEAQHIARAPMPRDEIEEHVRRHVEKLAAAGRPSITGLHDPAKFSIRSPKVDPLAHLAFIDPEAVKARFLQSVPSREGALSSNAKAQRLAEIDSKILGHERQEVALIDRAAWPVPYRRDTNPLAILELEERKGDAKNERAA